MDDRGIGKAAAIGIFIFGLVLGGLIASPRLRAGIIDALPTDVSGSTPPVLNPKTVKEHPNEYLGREITIEGKFIGGGSRGSVIPPETEEIAYGIRLDLPDGADVFNGGIYRFTGVLKKESSALLKFHVQHIQPA